MLRLSLYIRHRAGIFVHHVVAGSPADESGCFSVGDRILEVNGYDIKHTTIDHAAAVMGVREEEGERGRGRGVHGKYSTCYTYIRLWNCE